MVEALTPTLPRKYKIVVSDFHLGKGRYLRDGTQNILEDFIYDKEFAELLYFYIQGEFRDAEVELILNGDILNLLQMDSWGVHTHLITERSVVRAVGKIIEGHTVFFDALKKFASTPGHSISYIVGNHDVGMLWGGPRKIFSEACGCEVRFYDEKYLFDGVYVEHGQQYEWFSRINMQMPFLTKGYPEAVLNLPWGSLFVAILLPMIKQQRPHADKVRPIQNFLTWALLHDSLWAVKAIFTVVQFIVDTILLKRRYQILRGLGQSLWTSWKMIKEISVYPSFDKIAFKLLEENDDIHTVIFGHTHILRYRQYKKGKEYFNEGSWNEVTSLDLNEYGTHTRLTFAWIEYPDPSEVSSTESKRPRVRMKEWKGIWRPEMDIIV